MYNVYIPYIDPQKRQKTVIKNTKPNLFLSALKDVSKTKKYSLC